MRINILLLIAVFQLAAIKAQEAGPLLHRTERDTIPGMSMDAVYNRPFLETDRFPVALGGYVEADYRYMGEEGVTDGHSFRIPRMTLFVSASIHPRIKFLSELELEEGGREITLEFAALDFVFHPMLNLRGGVVMNPIGAFNQNHDGPLWEFVERPVAMTQMLPATWSNVGFGLYGKQRHKNWTFGYEAYLTNGFDDTIISNGENRTFLPASRENTERFEESFNGDPLFTGKTAVRHDRVGELGISYMGGVYNKHVDDGIGLDKKRRMDVFAVDFNTVIGATGSALTGEWAWIWVDVPETYTQQYGSRQRGGFLDVVQPVLQRTILGFDSAVLNLACRLEYVDWNVGRFHETGGRIADDLWAVVPGVSFRPTARTVLRLNYRHMRQRDILGNSPVPIGGVQLGVSSYF